MAKTANLNMRVDDQLAESARAIYRAFGITITDAVNMFFAKSVMEGGLPFELKQRRYNAETEQAIRDAQNRVGISKTYDNVNEMLADLYA